MAALFKLEDITRRIEFANCYSSACWMIHGNRGHEMVKHPDLHSQEHAMIGVMPLTAYVSGLPVVSWDLRARYVLVPGQ